MTSTTLYLPSCLRTATSLRDRRYSGLHSPSIFIACTRLVLMRLNDPARVAISSLPLLVNSGASRLPRLTSSAIRDSRVTGRIKIGRASCRERRWGWEGREGGKYEQ